MVVVNIFDCIPYVNITDNYLSHCRKKCQLIMQWSFLNLENKEICDELSETVPVMRNLKEAILFCLKSNMFELLHTTAPSLVWEK